MQTPKVMFNQPLIYASHNKTRNDVYPPVRNAKSLLIMYSYLVCFFLHDIA